MILALSRFKYTKDSYNVFSYLAALHYHRMFHCCIQSYKMYKKICRRDAENAKECILTTKFTLHGQVGIYMQVNMVETLLQ